VCQIVTQHSQRWVCLEHTAHQIQYVGNTPDMLGIQELVCPMVPERTKFINNIVCYKGSDTVPQ
jgi:hypothetical protein